MMRRGLFLALMLVTTGAFAAYAQTPATPPSAPVAKTFSPAATGDEDAGHDVFMSECRICHLGGIAPSLKGVVGRHIASDSTFTAYTPALKARSNETWTEAQLDTFLSAPNDFAPGTRMTKTVTDKQTRADVIAYLKSLPAPQ